MSERSPSAANAGHFWCPNCEEAQYPDEVGVIVCEACGAETTTYETAAEIPEAERV